MTGVEPDGPTRLTGYRDDLDQGRLDFFAGQPMTMGASALLLRDRHGRVVLVKPTYRSVWHLPGGLMEADESPRQAAQRETTEELGLEVGAGRLLCVDYKSATTERPACTQFVFDGGSLTDDHLSRVRLARTEIAEWRAVDAAHAPDLVQPGGPASRLRYVLRALTEGTMFYLEDGRISSTAR